MALEQPGFAVGFCVAAADLSAKQFYCVKVTAAKTVGLTAAAGEAALGVLQNKPKSGEVANVMCIGVTKLIAGAGDLAAGAQWEANSDGKGITAATGKVGMGTVLIGAVAGGVATVTVGIGAGNTLA